MSNCPGAGRAGGAAVVAEHEDGASVAVHPRGAHLTSWRNRDGEELLYTSPDAVYKSGVPIRGGVPIIFPQFGNMGPLPAHGFARIREWTVKEVRSGMISFALDVPSCDLQTRDYPVKNESKTASTVGVISLLYTITFNSKQLQLQMEITNKVPDAEVRFTFAFHTYFAVGDIRQTLLDGVNTTPYVDNLDKERRVHPPEPFCGFKGEVDRVYLDQRGPVCLMDMVKGRTFCIVGEKLPDVVVWNPWVEKTARLKDLPADGYTKFVCVEHGAIGKEVTLPPQEGWRASQCILLAPVSKA